MKKIMFAVLAGTMATSAFAAGPVIDEDVSFTGVRAVECSIGNFQNSVSFGTLGTNGSAGQVQDTGVSVFCNQPSTVTLESESGFLKLQANDEDNDSISESNLTSAANPGFAAGVNYSATVFGLTGNTTQINAQQVYTYGSVPALNIPSATISYNTLPGSMPLLGGTYQDTVTITLTPNGV
jgi:hypothetical protein